MTYDFINSFKLKENRYLFFDIFHKNNELILICPVYSEKSPNFNNIKIKCLDKYLKLKKSVKKIRREPIVILIYQLNNYNKPITVIYNNIIKKYNLQHLFSKISKKLTQTTLMKNDYKLINIFYDYYKKQGVQYFYIYYNGKLNETIRKEYKKENVKLIEWDFKYWNENCTYRHHAQLGQIHHALYKYGKQSSEYMIFNDLDEYMYSNKKLIDLISSNLDTYGFLNHWSNTLNNKIPDTFPSKIKIGEEHSFGNRSKCIHKTNSVSCIGIHTGNKYNSEKHKIIKNSGKLLHFYNWTKTKRNVKINNIFFIGNNLNNNFIAKNYLNKKINYINKIYNIGGIYKKIKKDFYKRDDTHHLYKWKGVWRLGNHGVKVYYILNNFNI